MVVCFTEASNTLFSHLHHKHLNIASADNIICMILNILNINQ